MATFFARRYMRKLEEVGRTEKVLGILVLLLLAGIIAAYVAHSETNRDYLFDVDDEALSGSEDAHEITVAKKMLPAQVGPGWRAGGVQALSADGLAAALDDETAALTNFGAIWVFRRRYESIKEPGADLTAMVCDVATPAQAFGLTRARRPAEAEASNLGRGGWQTPSRTGFWKGRYYTELRVSAPRSDAAVALRQAAAAVAGVQLDYGGSFWAEKMLPPEGRVQGSLRYVHRHALGFQSLDAVFLVDLVGGTTAWVMDAKTVSRAAAVVERIKKATAPSENRRDGPLTFVDWKGDTMAIFAAGRYVHGAIGDNSDAVAAAAMSAVAQAARTATGVRVAVSDTDAPRTASGADGPFPEPGVEGWRPPDHVSRFTPDNLYTKIDGRAGLYLQFHVVGMVFGTYFHQRDPDRAIDVYWYDMGKAENALGIFRAEAPHDATPVSIGQDGYQTGGAVFFLKGTDYVQLLPTGPDESDGQVALKIGERIGEGIGGGGEAMWALAVLPEIGRVADSLEYLGENAFSLDFLNKVFTAEYDRDGGRITLFIHRSEDETSAKDLLDRYAAFFQEYGEVVWTDPDGSRRIVAGSAGGVIDVVFAKGRYLGGVAGADDADTARKAAVGFYDELAAP